MLDSAAGGGFWKLWVAETELNGRIGSIWMADGGRRRNLDAGPLPEAEFGTFQVG